MAKKTERLKCFARWEVQCGGQVLLFWTRESAVEFMIMMRNGGVDADWARKP